MSNHAVMMGFETAADQKVALPIRHWNGLKLALWRSRVGWEIVMRTAADIVKSCQHLDGCPGAHSDSAPCLDDVYEPIKRASAPSTKSKKKGSAPLRKKARLVRRGCPDRDTRMNALVILGAARQLAPIDARPLAQQPYTAPSREWFSEVVGELAATQAENEALRAMLRAAGIEPPATPPEASDTIPSFPLPPRTPQLEAPKDPS